MYCSSCGTAVVEGLNYCKNCGARINDTKASNSEKLSEASFNLLIAALIGVPIAGIGIIIGLLVVMKEQLDFANDMILAITFMSFVLLIASESALIWLLMQSTKSSKSANSTAESNKKETARLNQVVIKNLNEGQARGISEPVPSVIENTTRNLEPVYQERKS